MSACLTAIQFDQENRFSRRLRLQAFEVEFSPKVSLPGAGAPVTGSVLPWLPSCLSCVLERVPETCGSRAAQACCRGGEPIGIRLAYLRVAFQRILVDTHQVLGGGCARQGERDTNTGQRAVHGIPFEHG